MFRYLADSHVHGLPDSRAGEMDRHGSFEALQVPKTIPPIVATARL